MWPFQKKSFMGGKDQPDESTGHVRRIELYEPGFFCFSGLGPKEVKYMTDEQVGRALDDYLCPLLEEAREIDARHTARSEE